MTALNLIGTIGLSLFIAAGLEAAPRGLVAHYAMDGDFKDAARLGRHLRPVAGDQKFAKDEQIRADENLSLEAVVGKSKCGAYTDKITISARKGVTICGFFLQPGHNNYRGTLFGFGSADWQKPGFLIRSEYGVIAANADSYKVERYQRLEVGRWHHLALVLPRQRSRKKQQYDLYVDGKKVLRGPCEYPESLGRFVVGDLSSPQGTAILLDEIKVFSRALSAKEIAEEAKLRGKVQAPVTRQLSLGKAADSPKRHQPPPAGTVPLKGDLRVRFLTRDWLCVVGDYTDFFDERLEAECGEFLGALDKKRDQIHEWSYNFHYGFAAAEVASLYRPLLLKKFEDRDSFRIEADGRRLGIVDSGYWMLAIGQQRAPIVSTGEVKRRQGAEVAQFAFLKLAEPLRNGARYVLSTKDGESVPFTYDEKRNVSWAIKVNQVGYLPDAGAKYAYLGAWLGDQGALRLSAWRDKPFHLIDTATGRPVFSGKIRPRAGKVDPKAVEMAGEDVYDLDFSSFTTPGTYAVYVPGIGRSWQFRLGKDALGEAFFVHTRGLYHKRCGIAKEKAYTNWVHGACHTKSYVGAFPPNDRHGRNRKGDEKKKWGFFDEKGKRTSIRVFRRIADAATETDRVLPNVWGGWHDAADYDRRTYHFRAVRCLLGAYLMFPKNFTDGQLNIPESGNGIPDIVDEAAWGVDVWRRAQNAKGGVGCWLEATSHPKNDNPATDEQRYYLAWPTRESTIDYAAHAAMLASAYRKCGAEDQCKLFLASAVTAYDFAMDPRNTCDRKFRHCKNPNERDSRKKVRVTYRYQEPKDIPPDRWFKAAWNLHQLTGESRYLEDCKRNEAHFKKYVQDMWWRYSPWYFVEVYLDSEPDSPYAQHFAKMVTKHADERIEWQQLYPYRRSWYPPSHGYVRHVSWGCGLPMNLARFFITAWRVTGDQKYRDAALLCNDLNNGTNPLGRSFTSGLGKVYPARFLDLPSYSDGIEEFVPGITVYFLTGGMPYEYRTDVCGLYKQARKDHGFESRSICLLPKSLTGGKNLSLDETSKVARGVVPMWRTFTNMEAFSVAQNEYTVWETIAPAAGVTGCLMGPGWEPSASLKRRRPAKSIRDLHGYIAMP